MNLNDFADYTDGVPIGFILGFLWALFVLHSLRPEMFL